MTPQHPAAPETETDANGLVPAEAIDRLRLLDANRTPGDWKLWGMIVMASQDGTSNVDTAVDVAHTFHRDENGKPRTWDADFIATSARYMSALLADLDAARERVRVVEGERDAAMAETEMALRMHDVQWSRAESAEAAHEAEKAAHERLRAEFVGARDDIRARRQEFRRLNADEQYLSALDDAFGLVSNRLRAGGEAR